MGSRPAEIVYSCATYSGIMARSPDLVPILKGEGYSVYEIPNPYPAVSARAAQINVHPKFDDVEVIVL